MSFHKQTFHKDTFHQEEQEIPEEILRQLEVSKINGFPFFSYTGIKEYLMYGNEELWLKKIPKNPKGIEVVKVIYDLTDTYKVIFQGKTKRYGFSDVYVDQLADLIVREMGVK